MMFTGKHHGKKSIWCIGALDWSINIEGKTNRKIKMWNKIIKNEK